MSIRKLLVAVPMLLCLNACSCKNNVAENIAIAEDAANAVEVIDIIENTSFFGGRVADRVFFSTAKSTLNGESKATLDAQAGMLQGRNDLNITVEGHCDERGPREYNLALGERRANSAKHYLCKAGVDCSGVNTVSYGKERPAVDGHSADAWAQNRRAVTVVEKKNRDVIVVMDK